MRKIKTLMIVVFLVLIAVGGAALLYSAWEDRLKWPEHFRAELDAFFGEGNWEWVSEEVKESRMYEVRDDYVGNGVYTQSSPGKYHVWNIAFTNRNGEREIWTLSDHAMQINHSKENLFTSGRYSAKQAFTQQLMEISFMVAEEEISREILREVLSQQEADCLEVDISYRGGNPPPQMYDELINQPWFHVNQAAASDYLASDLYDFYIWIHAHDYKVEKLTESEKQHLLDSLPELEKLLHDTYGESADYEIYLDAGHKAASGG